MANEFCIDQLANGRRFSVLKVVNDYDRERVGQLTSVSITGNQVARFLEQIAEALPDSVVCDNGPEFTCKALFFGSQETRIAIAFIQPAKPTHNAWVESFNGKFKNACLSRHWHSFGGKRTSTCQTSLTFWLERAF